MANILAANTTAATSSDVTLADGARATLVAYADTGAVAPSGLKLQILVDTAGADTVVGYLEPADPGKAGQQVVGPGTFRVYRPKCSVAIAVDSL